ncbi:capsid protein [Mesorhizobium sp. B2-3-5]|nr:capsid protein [Mesorhizobium sp. B2-3-5]TPM34799.1 capsid protein [Mesorhizobium sp. B2-3-5]
MALVRISVSAVGARAFRVAVTPSPRTLRAELLRLCARIGYSPPASL